MEGIDKLKQGRLETRTPMRIFTVNMEEHKIRILNFISETGEYGPSRSEVMRRALDIAIPIMVQNILESIDDFERIKDWYNIDAPPDICKHTIENGKRWIEIFGGAQ